MLSDPRLVRCREESAPSTVLIDFLASKGAAFDQLPSRAPPAQRRTTTMRIPSRLLARSLSTTAPTPSSSSSAYTPPLAPGVLPAYDQALLYLSSDKTAKLESLEKLRAAVGSVGAGEGQAEAWEKRKEMEKLEVDAWVNDPETRWRAERGLGECGQLVTRGRREVGRWREQMRGNEWEVPSAAGSAPGACAGSPRMA